MTIPSAVRPTLRNATKAREFAHWDGKPVEIVGIMADPDDCLLDGDGDRIIDPLSMPVFHVRLIETGETNVANLNEIDRAFWPAEMRAVLAGQDVRNAETGKNPYRRSKLAHAFNLGVRLAEYKKGWAEPHAYLNML